jgi:hypothetical protein
MIPASIILHHLAPFSFSFIIIRYRFYFPVVFRLFRFLSAYKSTLAGSGYPENLGQLVAYSSSRCIGLCVIITCFHWHPCWVCPLLT